jgi:glutamate racemase
MEKQGAIGVFDSGYGGLTVLRELVHALPEHNFVYLGDNARAPYGNRSYESVYQYTLEAVRWFFLEQQCPLVILACNTASAKALRTIQQRNLPALAPQNRVLGVIRPTAEIIGNFSSSGTIGVLGTRGTVQSASYPIEIRNFFPHLQVIQEACPMWVPLVEYEEYNSPGADYFVKKHLDSICAAAPEMDAILLACTHYPLLIDKICAFLPAGIRVVTQGAIVASSLIDYLQRHPEMERRIARSGGRKFFTTEHDGDFARNAERFFGTALEASFTDLHTRHDS